MSKTEDMLGRMKYVFVLFIIGLWPLSVLSQSYRDTEQIQVKKHPFGSTSKYMPSHTFEKEFLYRSELSFTSPKPNKYKKLKVKTVELYNSKGHLFYQSQIDKSGKVLKTGVQGRKYFITNKNVAINKSHQVSETGYYKNDVLMRLDTVIDYVHIYNMGDTILTFHEHRTISYIQGGLVNKKNRYLNARYLNKKIELAENPFQVMPITNEKKEKKKFYLKKAFKTDYDSLSLFITKDVRSFSSPCHNLGEQKLTWENVKSHSFFKLFNQKSIETYSVEGANFNEPLQLQERMYCGNSDYDREHYYDGRSYKYSRLENGLYDTYSLYYYPVDPNPPKRKPIPQDSVKMGDKYVLLEIEFIDTPGPRRLSTPEIKMIYQYKYSFYE